MSRRVLSLAFSVFLGLTGARSPAQMIDTSRYRPQPGLDATADGGTLTLRWDGRDGQELLAAFAVADGTPTVRRLAARERGGEWVTLGRDLVPEFRVTTGVRRTGHGLDDEHRWDVFWDAPLNHPDEVRRASAAYRCDRIAVKTDGARVEVDFPGLTLGDFSGGLRFTAYRGSNLLRQEAVAATTKPSVAYTYQAGLRGLLTDLLPRAYWHDALGRPAESAAAEGPAGGDPVALRARNRCLVLGGKSGAVGVFPPPHQFFFAREIEVNLGFVWRRTDAASAFAVGVRQGDSAEGYNPVWVEKVFSLYNAPPGTLQRMAVYYLLSPGGPQAARDAVMDYTHGDRYKPLPGYKTMATHFHTAFAQELAESGSLDTTPPWIPLMKALGVNVAHIFDFHGDGHAHDPGPLRLKELDTYFEGCRRHSDDDFLILPGEEANAYLGGHYNILFPKPVYWTLVRGKGQPLAEPDPKRGTVYHVGNAADVFAMMKREDALVWQTHPRTKGSTGYPDKIRETDYLKSDQWLGTAFKAMPVDLSQKRLGEVRCFGTLDDMNNWGRPKFMVGEVDTYKKFPDYDLYGDFNVNYVKLDRVPSFDDWRPLNRALRAGEFFVTTGEVLIPRWRVEGEGDRRTVEAEVEWTFPLEFVEVVWGDGTDVGRTVVPATELPPFGSHRFAIPFDAAGKTWVRFAAWDSAGNGAFAQPARLR